ncbi:endonuclease/exonuclease/phosphatase family protein [Paractinoplanes rhizophilus]|uniref:Endonuclease/exonuclease/phosphatase family protein n=1 Tax=Paractinoplanes rhizophilus TaxID=1416877 RepID=A0ABW2I296_9ACTN
MLRRESPDLVALQELGGFDRRRIATLADSLGMVAHLAPSVFGQPVAVLVRPPLPIVRRESVTWRLHHAAAAVTAGTLTVVSTHLHADSPRRRYREATWLAHRYRRRGEVLIAGDMNALSGFEPMPSTGRFSVGSRSDPAAIAAFEKAGLVDLWKVAGTGSGLTVPTAAGVGDPFDPMRLDYVFGTPAVAARVRAVWVLRGDEIEYASDHHPLLVEIAPA